MHPQEVIAALRFEPLLPLWLIAALGALALLMVALAAFRRARGTVWRLAGFAVLVLWLAGPRVVQESRDNLPDIGLMVVDQSASMQVGERARLAEAARAALTQQAAKLPDLELRTVTVAGERRCRYASVRRHRSGAGRHPALAAGRHDRHHRRPGARHPRHAAGRRAAQRAGSGEGGGDRPPPARDRGAQLRHRRQDGHAARRHRGPRRGAPRSPRPT